MKIGSTDIVNCKIGSTQVNEIRIGSTLVWQFSSVDPDAQAFITAAGITNPTQQTAINTLVVSLKANGIWTKMKAIYPMVGGTGLQHSYNLKNTAQFQITWSGGIVHSSTGVTGNGTNGFGNTGLLPSTQLSLNSTHISYYTRTNNNGSSFAEMGVLNGNQGIFIIPKFDGSATGAYRAVNSSQLGPGASPTDVRGLYIASRITSTAMKLYRNSSTLFNDTQTSGALFSLGNVFLLASNVGGSANYFSARQCAFASIGDGLTDTDSSNLYTAVQAFNTSLGRSVGPQTVSDADAQAFVTAANIQDQVQADAVNNLVIGLKADGLWTKMKAIYPFVGGTSTTHKYNLKDPRDLDIAFRLVFNGGWTHSANGVLPNGTNGYADTFFVPSANQTIFNNGLGCYISANTFLASDSVTMGAFNSAGQASILISKIQSNGVEKLDGRLNAGNSPQTIVGRAGNFSIHRTSANVTKLYKNTSVVLNFVSGGTSLPTLNVFLGNMSFGVNSPYALGYTNSEFRLAYLSEGLSDSEVSNLYTSLQAFQTSLGRQI
jgi:hypothetical protein